MWIFILYTCLFKAIMEVYHSTPRATRYAKILHTTPPGLYSDETATSAAASCAEDVNSWTGPQVRGEMDALGRAASELRTAVASLRQCRLQLRDAQCLKHSDVAVHHCSWKLAPRTLTTTDYITRASPSRKL